MNDSRFSGGEMILLRFPAGFAVARFGANGGRESWSYDE